MIILFLDQYLDGGTREFVTSEGTYFLDHRLGTGTKGALYKGALPGTTGSELISDESVRPRLIEALEAYRKQHQCFLSKFEIPATI